MLSTRAIELQKQPYTYRQHALFWRLGISNLNEMTHNGCHCHHPDTIQY